MVRYGLGVDTGGTFTDAVLMDMDSMKLVAKAKSPTTHDDLSVGLYRSIEAVFSKCAIKPSDISIIGVSTTLATNTVLEGKGGTVGLIFIGWDPKEPVTFGEKNQAFVKGGFDLHGKMIHSLDEKEVAKAIETVSKGVDAIAISGLFSVLNPSQEKRVKEMAMEITGLPTVAGYELSSSLGIDERARTAVLNGKLIPVVGRFFDGLEATFKEMGLTAPIMVYKGDGSIMDIRTARAYPVESVFSGPAASSSGGHVLTGLDNFIMVDIGGTSTDIAIIEDGMPNISEEGANICGWKTHVKAVDMYTTALGGDTRIALKESTIDLGDGINIPFFSLSRYRRFNFNIGPGRVIPLCRFTEMYPDTIEMIGSCPTLDIYAIVDGYDISTLEGKEYRVAATLKRCGPIGLGDLRDKVEGLWVIDEELKSLVDKGAAILSSLTPTDLMVYKGYFKLGNPEGPKAGLLSLSSMLLMSEERIADKLLDLIHENIAEAILTRLLDDRMDGWQSPEGSKFLSTLASLKSEKGFAILPRIDVPVIGIGAPTKHMMGDVGKRLGAAMIYPDDADVGNAIGAVCSKIVFTLKASIYPDNHGLFRMEVPYKSTEYSESLETAMDIVKKRLDEYLEMRMTQASVSDYDVKYRVQRYTVNEHGIMNLFDIDHITITGRAVGEPPYGNQYNYNG